MTIRDHLESAAYKLIAAKDEINTPATDALIDAVDSLAVALTMLNDELQRVRFDKASKD